MVRKIGCCRSAFANGPRSCRRKPALGAARNQQRADRGDRSLWPGVSTDPTRRSRCGGLTLRFSYRRDRIHPLRRLVRLVVRTGFGYSAGQYFSEENMILEDLEHRYEGLKHRITLVRSYL